MEPSNPLARKRVQNEKKDIFANPPMNWKIICSNQKWNQWDVWITAPTNCPFHSTPFKLVVQFGDQYPHKPPNLILQNYKKFFHPNISPYNGGICEQTIKSTKPITTMRQRIDAFVTLLSVPNADSPLNSQAAKLYKQSDPRKYYRTAFRIFKGYT